MIQSRLLTVACVLGIFATINSSSAYAADTTVPASATDQLTSQAEDFRKDNTSPAPAGEYKKPSVEAEKPEEEKPDPADAVEFVLNEVRLEGNTIFSFEDLKPLFGSYLGKSITLGQFKKIVRSISDRYREQGYLTSRAYLKGQKLDGGIATISILEGTVGEVLVEGNHYYGEGVIIDHIRSQKGKIFRMTETERALYGLNKNPDLQTAAYLTAGEVAGTSNINVRVKDQPPLHVYYEFSNRGTKLTHRSRHTTIMVHNNVTGHADSLTSSYSMAEEGALAAGAMNYSIPLPNTPTTLQLAGSLVKSRLIGHLKPFEVDGHSWSVTPSVVHEFYANDKVIFSGMMGFEIKDSKNSVDDLKTSFDRMRVLVGGPRLTLNDAGGSTSLTTDAHWSMNGTDFIYGTGGISRVQRIFAPNWYATLRVDGQWAGETLPSVEQYRVGGSSSVRGYPESDATGDYGYTSGIELSAPSFFLPEAIKAPITGAPLSQALRWVAFLEAGKTYDHVRASATDIKDNFLAGTGIGVRLALGSALSAQADLGFPIGDDSSDQIDRPQIHFSIRSGF